MRPFPALRAALLAGALAVPIAVPIAVSAACAPDIVEIRSSDGRVSAFSVEIADDPEERARGLMFRDDLPRDGGMLFVWESEAPRSFWMKNTPLSLDMLFADADGRICGVVERAEPFSLDSRPSGCAAQAVLEIHGGLSARLGIAPGAEMRHPVFGDAAAWPCD